MKNLESKLLKHYVGCIGERYETQKFLGRSSMGILDVYHDELHFAIATAGANSTIMG